MLQISMGTGFKCVSAVWRARRSQKAQHPAWAPPLQPFARHAPGYLRPRALRIAAEQEAAEKARSVATLLACLSSPSLITSPRLPPTPPAPCISNLHARLACAQQPAARHGTLQI